MLENLETLSANAAEASQQLNDITKTLNDPNNILVLQQTLDSARVTFENTQKITSDLEDLTGDTQFRQNLKELVNGLSGLVSSTEQIEQQVKFAATLDSVKANLDQPQIKTPTRKPFNELFVLIDLWPRENCNITIMVRIRAAESQAVRKVKYAWGPTKVHSCSQH